MKQWICAIAFCVVLTVAPTQKSHAFIWDVVKQALIAAIKAADLAVQRLQNKTIWLQNAQKALENTLSKLKLDEISGWVEKHKEQYASYFDELRKVKEAISGYKKVKVIMQQQLAIVDEYKAALRLFRQDKHFTTKEIEYMVQVYSGILDQSIKNIDQLFLVIKSLNTEMTDGKRLEVINRVASAIDGNLADLRMFNAENVQLSLQRAKDATEVKRVKEIYGIK
ncbi:conjugal transfer protein TraI [Paraflavitalea pollutisoli]|uniref:conjugal transfer protein TraI n=1 Tax=Paraflavitalea pollutisoli TaxID=3034143 RepID=UPI0023EC2BAD|nr:conjugal transfer protein TraI [Paraflavitalea sp. H1-2-19X]